MSRPRQGKIAGQTRIRTKCGRLVSIRFDRAEEAFAVDESTSSMTPYIGTATCVTVRELPAASMLKDLPLSRGYPK